jgi:hypothetical protein
MAATDRWTAADAYNTLKEVVENKVYEAVKMESDLLNEIPVKTDFFGGESVRHIIEISLAGAVGHRYADVSEAYGAGTGNKEVKMNVLYGTTYGEFRMSAEAAMATRDSKRAARRALEPLVRGLKKQLKHKWARTIVKGSSTEIGVVSAFSTDVATDDTVTLATISDAYNFLVGKEYDFVTSGTTVDETAVCTKIDHQAGKITFDRNVNAGGADTSDKIYPTGQVEDPISLTSSGTIGANPIKGIRDWIPSSVSSTAFFGLDRSQHHIGLNGFRASNADVYEGLYNLCVDMDNYGCLDGKKVIWMSPAKKAALSLAAAAGVVTTQFREGRKVGGLEGDLMFLGPKGAIPVKSDPNFSNTEAYILDMDTWFVGTAGGFPHSAEDTMGGANFGAGSIRGFDGQWYLCRAWWQLLCSEPSMNARLTIS